MKQKFDIGIIGAGLSGLTLGNSLLSKKIKNFILIEKNTHLKNDKTYSFWSGPGLFDIKKSFSVKPKKEWSQIEIKVKNKSYNPAYRFIVVNYPDWFHALSIEPAISYPSTKTVPATRPDCAAPVRGIGPAHQGKAIRIRKSVYPGRLSHSITPECCWMKV